MNNHYHFYKFNSLTSQRHTHRLFGHTEYMIGMGLFHFHVFYGSTSFDGHFHTYSGITGLPVKTANGHKHRISGHLELIDDHSHEYANYTHEDIEHTKGKVFRINYHSP